MKIGKLPEQVLVRSVFKQIGHRREEVILGPAVGQDCAAVKHGEDEVFVLSSDPVTGTAKEIGRQGIHITANDLAAAGAEPVGVLLTLLLPGETNEHQLREIMRDAEDTCRELNIEIMGGHTEVTRAVKQPLLTVTGIGKMKKADLLVTRQIRPGQNLVVTKWIGLEATAILAKEKEEQLKTHFPDSFVETAKAFDRYLSVIPDARAAMSFGVSAMHDITEGGILGALWEMAEGAHLGFTGDMKKIPIRQETVEICEFFGLNPYKIMSSGSMMIVCDDGEGLVRVLEEQGIHATVVGRMTDSNDRILKTGEEIRYLERPQSDELYKVMG